MTKPYEDSVLITPELPRAGGAQQAVVDIVVTMLDVSPVAMAVCAPDARPLASNRSYRQLAEALGEPLHEFVRTIVQSHEATSQIIDEVLQLSGRAAPVGPEGPPETFVVALSETATFGPALTTHTVRIVRDSLARAMHALEDAEQAPMTLDPDVQLSVREEEVFRLLASGLRVSSIAQRLHVSESTVRTHLKAIFRKSGVHSQAALFEKLDALNRPGRPLI